MARNKRPRYLISVVADMFDVHPQTLRTYEREGLIRPGRSQGNTRLYSDEDLARIELILRLTKELGVNLAPIVASAGIVGVAGGAVLEDGLALRRLHVERERPLVAVDRLEVGAEAVGPRRPPAPGVVPDVGPLDLHDVRAERSGHLLHRGGPGGRARRRSRLARAGRSHRGRGQSGRGHTNGKGRNARQLGRDGT